MKLHIILGLLATLLLASGCVQQEQPGPVIGGDTDAHGCLIAAGYSWCEAKQKCLRIWEEACEAETPATGNFVLLISDAEADINDFESVHVTFSSARIFETDTNEGFEEVVDLNGATVDLTEIVGEKAIPVVEIELKAGTYTKIELEVESIDAVLKDGNSATVDVPSNKLKIVKPFTVDANAETKFVFDIQIVKKGQKNEYNLLPVIGKSGVIGKDINESEVQETEAKDEEEFCTKESGESMSLAEAREIANASACVAEGPLKGKHICNEVTGTWWIDLNIKKKDCNPACVIDVATKQAEINWRCTGLVE